MPFLKFLISKVFLKNLGIAIGVIALLLIGTFISLNIYTHHGVTQPVPDCTGLTQEQFEQLLEEKDFRFNIIDSVHITGFTPGAVVEQLPKAGTEVKKNRTIHFTINAYSAEKVQVPNLTSYSLRSAKAILESYGLKTGELIYIPSEYTNEVLGQHYKGKPIEPGTSIEKGSVIDLLLGQGLSDKKTNIPDLTGLAADEARHLLVSVSLNLGSTIFDSTVVTPDDSLFAFIWKQKPISEDGSRIPLGSSIDVWLSTDSSKILPDTLSTDSLLIESIKIDPPVIEKPAGDNIEEF
ncbi:PASTA domain-containing protein [Carboxylicivirga caseinilyticus]|uniref:PASTA domain-containing protein n=1 Tax=Carboxylicivirga caseinilyticus TaxID=3417572 RepID=UPI003D33ABDD|nr:PASTA domain-containing protein [Marinilabiliaceae bacterium A049]